MLEMSIVHCVLILWTIKIFLLVSKNFKIHVTPIAIQISPIQIWKFALRSVQFKSFKISNRSVNVSQPTFSRYFQFSFKFDQEYT